MTETLAHHHNHHRNGLVASIRDLVFGLEDSLVSTLGVVVGVAAGTSDPQVVILTGVVLVVVEALSMAAGSFLSAKSHRQLLEKMIAEEKHEIETRPEEEREELRAMYKTRGFSPEEIEILIKRIGADKKLMLEEMMAKELMIGRGELETPSQNAAIMLVSYVAGGVIPIAPYLLLSVDAASLVAVCLTVVALFALGYWKAKVTVGPALVAGLEMVAIAGSAAAIGYAVGKAVSYLFGIQIV